MRRLTTLAAASAVALLALGGTAFALGADDTPRPAVTATASPSPTPAASSIGSARASAIAVEKAGGGQVTRVERELEHGRVEWKVDVLNGNVMREIRVDDVTGAVVRDSGAATPRSTAPGNPARSTPAPGPAPRQVAPAPARVGDDGPLHDVADDRAGRSDSVSGHSSDDGARKAGDDRGRGRGSDG